MQGVLTGFAVIAVVIGVGYVLGLRGHLGSQGREVLTKLAFHVASPPCCSPPWRRPTCRWSSPPGSW